jgi:hypothetical protein
LRTRLPTHPSPVAELFFFANCALIVVWTIFPSLVLL